MPDYRAYLIGEDGTFLKAELIECPDDQAAIEAAKRFCATNNVELWDHDRKVINLPRKPK